MGKAGLWTFTIVINILTAGLVGISIAYSDEMTPLAWGCVGLAVVSAIHSTVKSILYL